MIAATLECVDSQGCGAVRLLDVAERADVSKAWILSVHPSRAALIACAVGDRFSRRVEHAVDLLTEIAHRIESPEAFVTAVGSALQRGDHVLEREEVWQFFEVLVWSLEDDEVDVELAAAKKRLVDAYERLTATLDDRGWLHRDTGPVSAAILLMAASLARVRLGSQEVPADGLEESLLLLTLTGLLVDPGHGTTPTVPAAVTERLGQEEHRDDHELEADDVRERILDAACHELAERGALEFRIRAVIDAARVSTTVIYKRFASRDLLVEHAAARLKTMNAESVRDSLTNALAPTISSLDGSQRDRMVLAVDAAYRSLRSNTPEAFLVGLNALVSGRRLESDEESQRRRREYYATVAGVFIQQLGLPQDVDPLAYVEIGPLAFFVGVVLMSFPDDLDSDVSVGSSVIRVVESAMSRMG